MSVNGEDVVRIARDRDESESITFVGFNGNHSERGGRTPSIAALPVDESSIRRRNKPCGGSRDVIPSAM